MSNVSQDGSISSLLTLIITTSPTPSAPSTELLTSVLESFQTHCPALLRCNVIVVFDTYEQVTTGLRLKKGYVTPKTAENYKIYKRNVKQLFLTTFLKDDSVAAVDGIGGPLTVTDREAEYGALIRTNTPVSYTVTSTDNSRVKFIEAQDRRLGFGLGVRSALRAVDTPYVWVHQHDWRLMYDIPITSLLGVMQDSQFSEAEPIKYVCLPSGRRSSYATSDQVTPYPELRKLAVALTGDYIPPLSSSSSSSSSISRSNSDAVPLTPMFFWHDKPHIVLVAHYMERVFPSRLAMMRGAFIEDTIGQKARGQMKEGQWVRWATWMYNPEEGKMSCLRHLHGRTWRGEVEQERYRSLQVLKAKGEHGGGTSVSESS